MPLICLTEPGRPECQPPPPPPPPPPKQFAIFLATLPTGGVAPVREFHLIPATGGELAPFLVKLGELLKLEVFEVDADTLEPVRRIEVVPTLGNQMVVQRPLLSEFFPQPSRLFPNNVLIQFAGESERDHFLPVHSGTGFVVFPASFLEPQGGTAAQPVSVPLGIDTCDETGSCGFSLGVTFNEVDADVIRMADLRGIPPQILKAQIQQETDPDFDPNSYRYEPLTVDFVEVEGLLLDLRFEPYRLEAHVDCRFLPLVIVGFQQGSKIPASNDSADVTPREKYQIQTDTKDQPICETVDQPRSPFVRLLAPRDRHVSMENILITDRDREGRRQNWTVTSTFRDYRRFRRNRGQPFTAQTVLAGSYGLMQVLYTTAVIDLNFTEGGVGRAPSRIFEVRTGLDLGTGYLRRMFRLTFPTLARNSTFVDFAELKRKMGVALEKYNRGLDPNPPVDENNLRDYATAILANSENFFPIR